jgi:uncharacterized protein
MQFVVTAHDGKDKEATNRRQAARPKHIALGDQMRDSGELLYAVAILDESDKMVGSICIVEFPSRHQLDAWLKMEPYVTGKVWEKIEIQGCRVGPSFAKPVPLEKTLADSVK